MFGGNSNWRGPLWFPLNYLVVNALERYHRFFGDDFVVEYPTGSGTMLPLDKSPPTSAPASSRFLVGPDGRRPSFGGVERLQTDPAWKDNIVFNEYFHGDNGAGLGAMHQTGWTGLVADLIRGRPGQGVFAVGDLPGVLRASGGTRDDRRARGGGGPLPRPAGDARHRRRPRGHVPPRPRDDRRLAALPRSRAPRAARRPAALRAGATLGLPLLAPWANRLAARRYRAAGVDVDLDGLPLGTDGNGLPIHGLLVGRPGWRLGRRSARARPGQLPRADRRRRAGVPVPAPHRGRRRRPRAPS